MLPTETGIQRISLAATLANSQEAAIVPAVRVALVVPEDQVARVASVVPEDPVVPAVRAALVVPENPVVPAVRAALVVPENPVVPAVRAALVVPENPVVPAVRAALVVLENPVVPESPAVRALAILLVAERELEVGQAVEPVPNQPRAQLAVPPRTKSVTGPRRHDQVLLLTVEDLAAEVVETTHGQAAAEAAIAWAAAE
jgi:hypothetical protein